MADLLCLVGQVYLFGFIIVIIVAVLRAILGETGVSSNISEDIIPAKIPCMISFGWMN